MNTKGKALIDLNRLEELEEKENSLNLLIDRTGYNTIFCWDNEIFMSVFKGDWEEAAKGLVEAERKAHEMNRGVQARRIIKLRTEIDTLKDVNKKQLKLNKELKKTLKDERNKPWWKKLGKQSK